MRAAPLLVVLGACAPLPAEPVIAAYLPDYRLADFRPAQAEGLTDLILFSVRPDEEGRVLDPVGLLQRVPARAARRWRVLLAVGGGADHRSDAFPRVAAEPRLRARFIAELVNLCVLHELDGLDVDWEHLGEGEPALLASLLTGLGEALAPRGLLLTVAVADPALLSARAVAAVDRVHLMAYDGPAHGSLGLAQRLVDRALAQGMPPSKLYLGIPLYGQGGQASAPWRELQARALPPGADQLGELRFNGPRTTAAKVELVKARRLGGVFFWELSQDARGEGSLIRLVRDALRPPARKRGR